MLDCLELLDNITEIYPIAGGTLRFPVPFNVEVDEMNLADILVSGNALSLAWLRQQSGLVVENAEWVNSSADKLIINAKPKIKATPKSNIAGNYFEVSISATTYADVKACRTFVRDVRSADYFDTFIVDADDNIYLLRGIMPASAIKYTTELPRYNETTIAIDVECVNGLQLLS